ncbi:MAG TPA: GTP cyclohydrolase II [Candidatus Eisenbacteria bacterium]|nr:GTP cyclohydrolase II [Candidatus Eisenbacteria bacterium]
MTFPLPRPAAAARIVAAAALPSRFGRFRAVAFAPFSGGREHLALVRGRVRGRAPVTVRLHSECLTGDVLGSMRCDCRDQLLAALERLGREGRAALLYLRQEGRGIGLANKIRAYALQDRGLDTVDANRRLGFEDDARDYGDAAAMLAGLGVQRVRLLTNNPDKVAELERHGIEVVERLPLLAPVTAYNRRYLRTKQRRFGHLLGALAAEPA